MKRLLTLSYVRIAIEIILVLAALAFAFSHSMPSQAATESAPAALLSLSWYQCNAPMNVAVFNNRVHVFCATTTAEGGPALSTTIKYFAVPTSPDSASASRYLSIFQSSSISGKTLWVFLDPTDTSGSSFGCGSGDCRVIYGAELR